MVKTGDDKSTSSNMVDVMSPYYVHPSDNPGQVYISEVLRHGNYAYWMEEMTNFLFAKNKFGFVDGTIPIPDEGLSEILWKRCNAMVKGWLTISMEKVIRDSVKHGKTARAIWLDLKERLGKESTSRAYELKRALTLTCQEKMSVSTYHTKLKGIWFNLSPTMPKCTYGKCTYDVSRQLVDMLEKEHLYEFLMILDEVFNTVNTQILSTNPTLGLGAAYHLVANDEQQRLITSFFF